MISGIDLTETMDYVSKLDTEDIKTIFVISPVSSRIQARVGKLAGADGGGALDSMMEAFRFGVKDIKNLQNKQGVPVKFKTEEVVVGNEKCFIVSKDIVDILPLNVIIEVGAKIMSFNNLTEEEAKN